MQGPEGEERFAQNQQDRLELMERYYLLAKDASIFLERPVSHIISEDFKEVRSRLDPSEKLSEDLSEKSLSLQTELGELKLFFETGTVISPNLSKKIHLSRTFCFTLELLMRNYDAVVSPREIGEIGNPKPDTNILQRARVTVNRLRRKLGETTGRELIFTVPGYGYTMTRPQTHN